MVNRTFRRAPIPAAFAALIGVLAIFALPADQKIISKPLF